MLGTLPLCIWNFITALDFLNVSKDPTNFKSIVNHAAKGRYLIQLR